ncbi:MAG: amidohydrolase family protein, partial [Gammaproteobacteria bacterium]|nr:amidohydrolase family protein [Gammaproteobacteria bacterium]
TWGVEEEAVPDRMTLMLMMTRWAAYPIWKENSLGSLEPGKYADLVILDGDYMAVPVEELDQLTSVLTMIDGRVSHETPELRGNTLN